MHILMLVSSNVTTDPRLYNEARALIDAGHRVSVIGWDRFKQNPYRELLDGIEVIRPRISLPPGCGLGVPPWHALHLLLWQQAAYREAMCLNKKSAFDAVHCHFLDTMPVGIRLKRKLAIPLVYDARDMYGYMMQASFPRWIARGFELLEKRWVAKADVIIAVSDIMQTCLRKITDRPVEVIMNCKPLQATGYRPPDNGGRFTVLYIGTLHHARALPQLLQAIKDLKDVFCVIGGIGEAGYVESIREECRSNPNVSFVGRVPVDRVLPMTAEADVVFCMFDPANPNNRIGMPNKLFEAMVCGRPIICTRGIYSGQFTEEQGIGLAVEYETEALRQALIQMRDDPRLREEMGRRALSAAVSTYNWQSEQKKLVDIYGSLQGPLNKSS
ncbi:MAG: glycosyltransferase family 4 protein [Dehalococcoidia bacterium]